MPSSNFFSISISFDDEDEDENKGQVKRAMIMY